MIRERRPPPIGPRSRKPFSIGPGMRKPFSTGPVVRKILSAGLAIALLGAACSGTADRERRAAVASAVLQEIADEVWQRRLERDVALRLREGLAIERLPDIGYEAASEDAELARSVLERLETVDADLLDHQETLSLEILRWQAAMEVEGLEHFWLESVLTPYSSPLAGLPRLFAAHRFEADADLAAYAGLVEQVPAFVDALHRRAREQLDRGIVVPEPALPAVVGLVAASIRPPDAGPWAVADERLAGLDVPEERIDAFRERLATAVEDGIDPALERFRDFLDGDYRAAAPGAVGIAQYPGGEAAYRYLVRRHTTMEVTPEEVRSSGEAMVAEMEEAMAGIRREIGWEGTREEFHEHLRTDPRFFPGTPDEVADRLMSAADAFGSQIDRFFLQTPEAPYGVRRLDPALEGSQTYGYYQWPEGDDPRGYYRYNGSDLDQRSWLNLTGVALHELVPGHHFQIARQFENDALPDFRRASFQTAYTEGWGSYASYLGREAGLYDDPYSHYGLYVLEIFLATRLVVDPGMNAFGWSLDESRDYMRDHTLESESQIATESLRYSTDMPGQALGYQMGKRKLMELRARAEEALGGNFDVRRFHEAVLASGSMPMTVLEMHVELWLEAERERRRRS